MKQKYLALIAGAFLLAAAASAQTNTPTNTPTSTPTPTPTITPTFTAAPVRPCVDLVVPNGATDSNTAEVNPGQPWSLTLYVPGTIDASTEVQVSPTLSSPSFKTLTAVGGSAVTVAASKGIPLDIVLTAAIRIHQSAAAAQRTFTICGAPWER